MKNLTDTITFPCGKKMKNRFMLAPLTNSQSHEDGTLSEDEKKWLVMRAKGGFGLTMTCASHVQAIGKGFPGQLGIFGDEHIAGHTQMCNEIRAYNSLSVIQLHHAGLRTPSKLINGKQPVAPSDNEEKNARALTLEEVKQLRDDFINAAVRAKKCTYDGVEIHGAHGYILSQFISKKYNHRTDEYGGSLENRSRIIFEIINGVREKCGNEFLLGIRLSPERFGMEINEMKIICQQLIDTRKIDFLDISLWDSFKYPEEEAHKDKLLLKHFSELDFKGVQFTVAGKISTAKDVRKIIDSDVDFVTVGRSGILHHDFPKKVINNPNFEPARLPVSKDYLRQEGLGKKFVEYMCRWEGFVEG